jgi:hypothetical protein
MAGQWARIVAECEEYPILIEALIEDGGAIKRNVVYLGFHGPLGECYPFVLLPEGRLDYGGEGDADQYADTNFLTVRPREGATFTIEEFDEETGRPQDAVYTITRIERL